MSALKDTEIAELQKIVRRLVEEGEPSFAEAVARIKVLKSAVTCEAARALAPRLNDHLNKMPQDTLREKRDLASWLNEQLRELGMAIRTPEGPAILLVNTDRRDEGAEAGGRFRVASRRLGNRRSYGPSIEWVPELELIEDAPRVEGGSRHRGRVRE